VALGLGIFGGFTVGLFALGGPAFGWPTGRYLPLVQAHGQVQTLGLAGLLILAVGGLLLPAFWRARLAHPRVISSGGALVGLGVIAQLIGQPLDPVPVRAALLVVAAILPLIGFVWAGSELIRPRLKGSAWPAAWECLLLLAAASLIVSLVLRAALLMNLAWTGLLIDLGTAHGVLIALELDGFLLAATLGVQLRLLPGLARTRPVTGWVERLGVGALIVAAIVRTVGTGSQLSAPVDVANWLAAGAVFALFWATGLGRAGLAPTVQAPATLLPGRTRQVLRAAWAGLLLAQMGRATALLPADAATHAFTSIYLVPLILVVGIRMLPRVSAYPIRFPKLCGALIWAGLLGGVLRAFGGLFGGPAGWQLAWLGGSVVTLAVLIFTALAWSPWGVPTGVPREPEVRSRAHAPRAE